MTDTEAILAAIGLALMIVGILIVIADAIVSSLISGGRYAPLFIGVGSFAVGVTMLMTQVHP